MSWFVSALGVALALAGAAAIVSGAPYIQLEWGWTEVIAGTTALSAGIVTLALGAVLFSLRGLRRIVAAGAAASLPAAVLVDTVLPFPAGDLETEDEAARTRDDGATPTIPDPVEAPARRRMGRLIPRPRASKDKEPESPRVAQDGRSATGVDADPPAEPARDAEDRFAGHRPSIHPASPLRAVGAADPDGSSTRAFDQGSGPAASFASPPQLEEPARHVAEVPTVVGRYEAGGASYVLFSDGAIEVAAETGTHRFASMQDLRDHIERQEAVE
jgi:hypothetical protein